MRKRFDSEIYGTKIVGVALSMYNEETKQDTLVTLDAPNRHFNIFRSLEDRNDLDLRMILNGEQGFVTDTGIFLNRTHAYNFCIENGIPIKRDNTGYVGAKLFSEDLW